MGWRIPVRRPRVRTVADENGVEREVRLDHLSEAERPWVWRKLRAAWANPNADEAEVALKALAGQLERQLPQLSRALRHAVGADEPSTIAVTA